METRQYCGGSISTVEPASVLWRLSVLWGIASVLRGDSISTVEESHQYCGGCSVLRRVAAAHVGVTSIPCRLFSTVEG